MDEDKLKKMSSQALVCLVEDALEILWHRVGKAGPAYESEKQEFDEAYRRTEKAGKELLRFEYQDDPAADRYHDFDDWLAEGADDKYWRRKRRRGE